MKFYEVTGSLSEPITKVHEWIEEAENDSVSLPHAMNISSVNAEGKPSSRMVLLKRISPEGFGSIAMIANFIVTLVVSRQTPAPSKDIQELVVNIRKP